MMYLGSLLLLIECVCGLVARVQSTQDRIFPQMPVQLLLSPLDISRINNMVPHEPYVLYYSPLATQNFVLNANRRDKDAAESKFSAKKALLLRPIPYVKSETASYPSRYVEPPPPDAVSDYARYWVRPSIKKDKTPKNHRSNVPVKVKESPKTVQDQGPVPIVREHDPFPNKNEGESEATSESVHKNVKKKSPKNDLPGALELSTDGDRVEFQIQGHEGPKTYIFGFDTGDGKNRQFRLEEKLKDGTVKGHYGYYDARGKLRTIKYMAAPLEGYKEKHHESNSIPTDKELTDKN